MNNTIKTMPKSQRPYEKCMREGEGSLNDQELLAVILRTGTRDKNSLELASDILKITEKTAYPGLLGLMHLSLKELMMIHGIGEVKAVQLKCIGELSKRIAGTAAKRHLSFHDPQTIAEYYMERLRHEEQELLYCMMLDGKNHLLSEQLLSRGTVNATVITPREIFLEALKYHAVSLILIHNHPSGDPTPSNCDIQVTERVKHSGKLLGIQLLDHIIIGDQRYVSFREQGILGE